MRRTLLFCITYIFLCGAVSTRAQEAVDWALKAVELERIVFTADDPLEAEKALVEKAFCYKQCRRFQDAVATLARVRMYLLPPEEQAEVIYEKELCSYLAGDFEAAAAYAGEASAMGAAHSAAGLMLDALVFGECGRWEESQERAEMLADLLYDGSDLDAAIGQIRDLYASRPELKSEKSAFVRAFLPPLGHWYTDHYDEGLLSMALNAAAAGWCVWQCLSGCWISGILGGGIALNYTFMGNQERVSYLVEKYNHDALRSFNDSLKGMMLSHAGAE